MWGRRPGQGVRDRIAELDAARSRWAQGEQGELLVGAELDGLSADEWWVFHAIPRGAAGTDIDHLVIGVGGVYTVNTKNVSGYVWVAARVLMVGGMRTGYLPAAVHEAHDTAHRLSSRLGRTVEVRPILAFTHPFTVKAAPVDVDVLQAGALRPWLERQPRVFTPSEAYEFALVAHDRTTWA
jgi:hypothetical protein